MAKLAFLEVKKGTMNENIKDKSFIFKTDIVTVKRHKRLSRVSRRARPSKDVGLWHTGDHTGPYVDPTLPSVNPL